VLGNVEEKPEDMIHDDRGQADGESIGTQEQTNTDSTSMEQVYVHPDVFMICILYICYSWDIIIPLWCMFIRFVSYSYLLCYTYVFIRTFLNI